MIKRILLSILIVLLYLSTSFAATQDRLPTANGSTNVWNYSGSTSGCVSEATEWACVDDAIGAADNATTYIYIASVNNTSMFEYTNFSINSTAISNVKITGTCRWSTEVTDPTNIVFRLAVNGTTYTSAAQDLTASWAEYTSGTTWNNNPNTSSAWVEADVEGTGSNPIQEFGVNPTSIVATEQVECTQLYLTVTYTPVASSQNKLLSFPVEDWD